MAAGGASLRAETPTATGTLCRAVFITKVTTGVMEAHTIFLSWTVVTLIEISAAVRGCDTHKT